MENFQKWRFLNKSFDNPKDQGKQENQNGNFVDAVHHAQVDVARSIGIRLSKYAEKIIPYLTQFKKLLYLIFF